MAKKVRILGFNHDKLVTNKTNEQGENLQINQYGKGTTNVYAGISFEFVDFIMAEEMNSVASNDGGWGVTPLRSTLNNEAVINNIKTTEGISIGDKIKTIKKEYNLGNKEAINADIPSEDKLWLLASSEIWQNGSEEGYYGFCSTKEGEQYEYYRINNKSYDDENQTHAKKPTSDEGEDWWLRSPDSRFVEAFVHVHRDYGYYSVCYANYPLNVAPGFCI